MAVLRTRTEKVRNLFKPRAPSFNVVEEINDMLRHAIERRAGDVHIEPFERNIRIRFRIDGCLTNYGSFPISGRDEITAVLKVMASLDSTQKRSAQDGKIKFPFDNFFIEIRASVLPVKYGEKVVLRIQNTAKVELQIESLGVDGAVLPDVKKILNGRQGLILVTGSTGSGKTTSIYSFLDYINTEKLHIVTIEDPIEYEIPGLVQIQLSSELHMTYADILRAVLRQDPDVIVIGEIRDRETARVAIRAALTGHMVIASLHTNDAVDTLIRIKEMGIEQYLVAAALKLIVYQRLTRVLCPQCKRLCSPTVVQAEVLGISEDMRVYGPKGCSYCSQTGYYGRKPVFEILVADEEVKPIIAESTQHYHLRGNLQGKLRSTLPNHIHRKLDDGTLSCEEAMANILY